MSSAPLRLSRPPRRARGARFRAGASFLAVAVGLATGCAAVLGLDETTQREGAEDGGDASVADAADAGAPDVAITEDAEAGLAPIALAPTSLLLRQKETAVFTVTLTRTPTTAATVRVTLADLPTGVTASTATIGPGQTTATITVTAAADAALGPKTVRATSPDAPPSDGGTATLLVAGEAGTLDTTFDGDGLAADATKGLASAFYALAIQPDGKIVVGGIVGGPGPVASGGWLLRRFDADGKVDTAFSAAASALPVDGEIRAIALDAQNRIVCVGTSNAGAGGLPQLTVVRVTATGAVDTTFAGGVARVATLEAPSGSAGLAVTIDAQGAIYAAGSLVADGGESGIVARFAAANGARDAAWNGGKLRVVAQNRFVGVASEAPGSVTLGGTDTSSAVSTYYLARLGVDGGLDGTFGTFGTSTFAVSSRALAFTRVASGPLVLVGGAQVGGTDRYTGGLATPGGASIFARGFGQAAAAAFYGVAPVGNVGFVAAGHAAGPNGEARVTRVLLDGGLDRSFAGNGTAVLDPGGAANGFDLTLFAAGVQRDGRVLVAGSRTGAGAIVHRLWQ